MNKSIADISPNKTAKIAGFLYLIIFFLGIFALVGVPIAFINELNQGAVLLLLSGADYLKPFEADQLFAQVMFFFDLHEHGEFISQFLSLWLLPLDYLVFKSGFLPRILDILLMIGCFGYLIDVVLFSLFANSARTLSLFAFLGELLFALWLLIKGVNVEQWEKHALESA